MQNLITYTDFVGRYKISDQGYALDNFNELIAQVQYDTLIDMLGAKLYTEFETALLTNPVPQLWVDFRDGKTYVDNNSETKIYEGVKSFLVPAVYAKHLELNQYNVLNVGTVESQSANATNLSMFQLKQLIYQYHNEFIVYYYKAYRFLWTFRNLYVDIYKYFNEKRVKGIVETTSIH
jgi:hypothetical protein